jgi:hypothetical protein
MVTGMRNFLLAAAAAVALCAAGLGGAQAQDSNDGRDRWMEVKNDSQFTAWSIYIMPSNKDCCWSRDLLGDDIVAPNEKSRVNFDYGNMGCTFDILVTSSYPDLPRKDWNLRGVNVCFGNQKGEKRKEIILKGSRPNVTGSSDRWMIVQNDSKLTAFSVYAIPSNKECCWSKDLLGIYTIRSNGDKRPVNFNDGSGECIFDVRVTSSERNVDWKLYKVNVCGESETMIVLKDMPVESTKNRIVVKNDSQVMATSIFIIPKDKDCCWSGDLLGKDVIEKGKSLPVDFDDGTAQCAFDIRITRSDNGRDWFLNGVDVCVGAAKKSTIILKDSTMIKLD